MPGVWSDILGAFSPGGVQGWRGRQQDQDIQKQQAQQRAEALDQDAHAHAMAEGYLPVGPGDVVRRPTFDPGVMLGTSPTGDLPSGVPGAQTTIPPSNGSYIDKADPARIIKHTDANGDLVKWELPTPEEQQQRKDYLDFARTMSPMRQQAVAQGQKEAAAGDYSANAARAGGTGAGATASKLADTTQRGVAVPDDLADQYGIPRGSIRTPEQIDALTEKFNTVRGAQTRNEGAADRQDASIAAKASGVKSTHVTVGPGGVQSLLTIYNNGQTEETPMAAKANPAGGAPTAYQNFQMNRAGQNDAQARVKEQQDRLDKLQSQSEGLWADKKAADDEIDSLSQQMSAQSPGILGSGIASGPVLKGKDRVNAQIRLNGLKAKSTAAGVKATAIDSQKRMVDMVRRATMKANAPKIASRAHVEAYAQRYGMDVNEAMQAFQADGITVK